MCIGLGAGIADIVPMIAQKLPAHSTVSVFLHYFFVSIVIVNMDLPHIPWWIEGGVVGLAVEVHVIDRSEQVGIAGHLLR